MVERVKHWFDMYEANTDRWSYGRFVADIKECPLAMLADELLIHLRLIFEA
ncbi:hypothetical protein SAMN04515692_12076 [Leifsonia sp. CL147]|nr:hypothetical protein SAMN04515694_11976 [Leifsonia sp. CL154]SFL99767.1 hypothetical protein SAMN04515692_12076 [Leifsonia sp. CL147]